MATLSSHACPGDVAEIRDDDNNLISSWQFGAGAPSTFGASVYPGLNRTRSYDVTFNGGGQGVVIEDVGWVGEGSLSVDDSDLDAYNTSVWLELELDKPTLSYYRASLYNSAGQKVWDNGPSPSTTYEISAYVPPGTSETFTAYVALDAPQSGPPQDDVRFSESVGVTNEGWRGSLNFSPSASSVADPWSSVYLTANISEVLSGYKIGIYDENGTRVDYHEVGWLKQFSTSVTPGTSGTKTYTAYVAPQAPPAGPPTSGVRAVASITFSNGSVSQEQVEGVDVDALVSALASYSDEEIMLVMCASPLATHRQGTVCDQALAYGAAIASGLARKPALRAAAIAVSGTAAGIAMWWTLFQDTKPVPSSPAAPTVALPPPAALPYGPVPVPRVGNYSDWLALDMIKRMKEGGKVLHPYTAAEAARHCLVIAQFAISRNALPTSIGGAHPCVGNGIAIFLPAAGINGEHSGTAQHDWDAITNENPAWARLNYVKRKDREARGLSTSWHVNQPGCHEPYNTATHACHEFPYYASAQSGHGAYLTPLDNDDNRRQGSLYSGFLTRCKLISGGPVAPPPGSPETGSPFLVVPMPNVSLPPSGICSR